jgi:RsmE family RNA methyltransferase
VGPECGFSAHEKELVNQHKKSISISLGNLILRSETAAINIISILKNLIA